MPRARDKGGGAVADLKPPPQTRHAIENAEVSRIFRELADLLELEDANPFRIHAYRNAARVVEELPESVDAVARKDPHQLSELPGIGKDLAGKICEICLTGNLSALAEAQNEAPQGALELMRVPGLGRAMAAILCTRWPRPRNRWVTRTWPSPITVPRSEWLAGWMRRGSGGGRK